MKTVSCLVGAVLCSAVAQGQNCTPSWSSQFPSGAAQGEVYAITSFDFDGAGPEERSLVIAGEFVSASGQSVPRIAKWTAGGWRPVGSALQTPSSRVHAIAVFNGELYMAGGFTVLGSQPTSCIAKWTGTAWTAVSAGLTDPNGAIVLAMHVWDDDGPGPRPPGLYVAGEFANAGAQTARNIARWDGVAWSSLGLGVGDHVSTVAALGSLDLDGPGPIPDSLVAGGLFETAGGSPIQWLARWDGSTWSAAPALPTIDVSALCTFDEDGKGPSLPKLFVATRPFTGQNQVLRLDDNAWTILSDTAGGTVFSFLPVQDQGILYATGQFSALGGVTAPGITRWNGSSWQGLPAGPAGGRVRALHMADTPGVPANSLIAAGAFVNIGQGDAENIACWTGTRWQQLGNGITGPVNAITSYDADGPGPEQPRTIIGGKFRSAGATHASRIVAWDGRGFAALGSGVSGGLGTPEVLCLTEFDEDGAGPNPARLFVGGNFTLAGGSPAAFVARWDGDAWSPVGAGFDNEVRTLAVFDKGTGPELYAGGKFRFSGLSSAKYVARWNGIQWVEVPSQFDQQVNALCVFDEDGPGPGATALFVGHQAARFPEYIGRWDGSSWSRLGTGVATHVHSLATADLDGPGPGPAMLYVGGSFLAAGELSARRIAAWNGQTWQTVGLGNQGGLDDEVYSITALDDDGPGPRPFSLFVGGGFTNAGNSAANRVARFDGADWLPLAQGLSGVTASGLYSRALTVIDDDGAGPTLPALYVGGSFPLAGTACSGNIARWGCPPQLCYPNCDGSTAQPPLTPNDFVCFIGRYNANDPYANCDQSTGLPLLTANDFFCFLNRYAAGCS